VKGDITTKSAAEGDSIDGSPRIEFTRGVPELELPTVSFLYARNLTVATFTFTNPSSYPQDLMQFGAGTKDDLLLQIDLENVGTREQIEQLPTLHAVCEAAGVELRIYATSADSRAMYATHVVTPVGEDAVDAQIIWDASRYVCTSFAAERMPSVLAVTRDHFGCVLASLGRPEGGSHWELPPSCGVSSIDWEEQLPPRWSGVLRANELSALLSPDTMIFETFELDSNGCLANSTVTIPPGKGWMHLKDEDGTLVVPAFPAVGSSEENAELSVKSILVAKGNDEVDRFMSFMRRFEACTALKPSKISSEKIEGSRKIFDRLRKAYSPYGVGNGLPGAGCLS